MISTPVVIAISGVALLAVAGQAGAAVVPAGQIPATSTTAAGFALPGWDFEKQARGDLNGDGRADLAVVLVRSSVFEGTTDISDKSRALVVALGQPGGDFRRTAVAPKLWGCGFCGGSFWGGQLMPVGVAITNGNVVVEQTFGAIAVATTTHRIQWNAQARKFRLIGLDTVERNRNTGRAASVSTNHLTKRQIREVRNGAKVVSKTTRRVAVRPRPIAGLTFGRLAP
jgi:hypothetical protein